MHRPSYKPAIYHCDFIGCRKSCKTPGGLTQHRTSCVFNPRNEYVFPSLPNFDNEPADNLNVENLPPHTPPNLNENEAPIVPPTPSQSSPRRTVWTTKGRSGIYVRKHPYLDGMPYLTALFLKVYLDFKRPAMRQGWL